MLLPLFSAIVLARLLTQSFSREEVFYVKPTTGPTTECPSGDSPCHSLQYYANHSSFTNNSRFLFLEGEHHLDSVMTISNVANLSLAGVGAGVEIVCKSSNSGFHIEGFVGFLLENAAISKRVKSDSVPLSLLSGSEVSLNGVRIHVCDTSWFKATNILGSFTVFNSTFSAAPCGGGGGGDGGGIAVNYSTCTNTPCYFNFSSNEVTTRSVGATVNLGIHCSHVQVLIAHSVLAVGLELDYSGGNDTSVVITRSSFINSGMCCEESDLECGHDMMIRVNLGAHAHVTEKERSVVFEHSIFSLSSPFLVNSSFTRVQDTSVHLKLTNVTFANNSVGKDHTVIYVMTSAVVFENCTFEDNIGTPVGAQSSKVTFVGNNTFRNNSAFVGGGMQLVAGSHMYLSTDASILFENNHADYVGGAIYIDTELHKSCFFSVNSSKNIVDLINNTADYAGSAIYGDVLECCDNVSSCNQLYDIFNTSNTNSDPSAIAAKPHDVCLCDEDQLKPDCSYSNRAYQVHAFPGQTFPVRLAVVSNLFDSVVPGAIRGFFSTSQNATLGPSQISQTNDKPYCKTFNYSVNTTESTVTFRLLSESNFLEQITLDPTSTTLSGISVTVHLEDCPLGFQLSPATQSCMCDPRIAKEHVECDINDQSFLPPPNSWLGFEDTISNKTGVIFHDNCPVIIGYCLSASGGIKVTVNTSDSLCEPNRTGVLCGKCEEGYSVTLGNQYCVKCSNTHLLIILPIAAAGLFLVAILFALNLTVTEGSINGLIFYANVLGVNDTIPFRGESKFLYMFLAWLNLDLGIDTCLFDGMDGYAETWLQFIFPVYLWVIILVIIALYNKFPALSSRLGGENAVKVLATLLLLSYTKLQRTVVTILSFTSLQYPNGAVRYMWLYDSNLEFFKGKHLYLGIAGILVLVFLIVPYTLCLAFFQQLQACSGHRLFQWVNKLKPVFDAYAGPYKDKYRFWTGMLLIVRTLIIIILTANTSGSADFNLLLIIVVACVLLTANTNGIYKKWPHSCLESFFYLQLGLFTGGIFYASHNNGSISAVSDTSIASTLIVSLVVVGHHTVCRVAPLIKHCRRNRGYSFIGGDSMEVACGRMDGLVTSS